MTGSRALATDISAGAFVGKYEILRKLATGGMAEIYLAKVSGTAGFEKLVVLKRILPGVASDPSFVRMFLDEARLAATLQHPNIADVYDVGEEGGNYFFTMEYVHGEDARTVRVAAHRKGEQLPLQVSLAIVHGTAAALDYAHEKGIVHRDVSSSNVLVSYEGAVKLVDFGIARATSSANKTQTGTLKGKIPYMSPEQCRNAALDRRSDLWSLGVVLYELTTTRRPFRGDSDFAIMEQIVHGTAEPPTAFQPDYPMDLEAIVMRLLQREPAKRYQTGDELVEALEGFTSAHGLWASAKPIARYMRSLFGDKADRSDDYVATTISGASRESELRTPPSAITALPPADFAPFVRDSMAMPAVVPATPSTGPFERPEAPRRSRTPIVVGVVAVLGIGIGGALIATRGGGEQTTTSTSTSTSTSESANDRAETTPAQDSHAAAPTGSPTPTPTPTPGSAHDSDANAATTAKTATRGSPTPAPTPTLTPTTAATNDTTTAAKTATATTKATTAMKSTTVTTTATPATKATVTTATTTTTATTPATKATTTTATTPATTTPATKATTTATKSTTPATKATPATKSATTPATKSTTKSTTTKSTTTTKPKEPGWDPNSPFLPPN